MALLPLWPHVKFRFRTLSVLRCLLLNEFLVECSSGFVEPVSIFGECYSFCCRRPPLGWVAPIIRGSIIEDNPQGAAVKPVPETSPPPQLTVRLRVGWLAWKGGACLYPGRSDGKRYSARARPCPSVTSPIRHALRPRAVTNLNTRSEACSGTTMIIPIPMLNTW